MCDEPDEESDAVDIVREDEPDEPGGVMGLGILKGAELPKNN